MESCEPQSCELPCATSTLDNAKQSSPRIAEATTTPTSIHEPPVPVDVTQLGDSPKICPCMGVDKMTSTTMPVKLELAGSTAPPPRSVDQAGDPPVHVETPPAPHHTVVERPPSTPPSSAALTPSSSAVTPKTPPPCRVKPPTPTSATSLKSSPKPKTPPSLPSTPSVKRRVPPSKPKQAARPLEKLTIADAPVPTSPVLSPIQIAPKRPVNVGVDGAPFQEASSSTATSVTPTPSTSSMQTNMTTPRSLCQDQPSVVDDAGMSSSFGSIKTPGSSMQGGSYLLSHQRRAAGTQQRDSGAYTPSTTYTCDTCDGSVSQSYHHERKSRSVSPTSQSDSYRSSTSSAMRTPVTPMTPVTPVCQDSEGQSPVQLPQEDSSIDWPCSPSPYRMRAYSPRHVTEYKHCVAAEPDDVRQSRRSRENTHSKLFGDDKPDSPRTAAVASAAAAGGLKPQQVRRHCEDTQRTLFGPPDPHRRSSREQPDTHQSLFGPPPQPYPVQRRSRSCFHDTADLLQHDPSAGGRSDEALQAVRGRYALRHQDTSAKLFGDVPPVPSLSSPTPRPYRDHDIFLTNQAPPPSISSSITSTQPTADSLPSP